MQALENYPVLPLQSRRIREFFPFDVFYTADFPPNIGRSKTSERLYFFQGGTRKSSRVVGALNPAFLFSSMESFFKRSSLHLKPGINPSSGFGNATCIPPAFSPSPSALKIGKLFTTATKSRFQRTALLEFFEKGMPL